MKLLNRLAWFGFFGWLFLMVVSMWNVNSNYDLSGIALALSLPCIALFAFSMIGMAYHVEETVGQQAARDLHTARWLNRELTDTIKATDEFGAKAAALSRSLTETGWDCHLATRFEAHDEESLDALRLSFESTARKVEQDVRDAKALLSEILRHRSKAKSLLVWSNQAEERIRAAHSRTGSWISGPPVAGQYILVGEVEPQRVLVVINQSYKGSVAEIDETVAELEYALTMAPLCLEQLSQFLTDKRVGN